MNETALSVLRREIERIEQEIAEERGALIYAESSVEQHRSFLAELEDRLADLETVVPRDVSA